MNAYTYQPEEILPLLQKAGRTDWPSGTLRLEGMTAVTDPKEADVFICPGPLLLFNEASDMDQFPHMKGNEQRHIFFDISENITVFHKPCIFIRCNLKTHMRAKDANSLSWPWPVENYAECIDVPEGGFEFDVSFHGWVHNLCMTRFESTQSCIDIQTLNCDFARYQDFTGAIYATGEGIRRRAEFRNSMRRSRLCLCPESIPGDFPYRFFEAMSAGRVPVMVGREYILPFEDEIPYAEFIVQIDRGDAREAGATLRAFLDQTPDAELVRRGRLARAYWEKYLDRERWIHLMTYAVHKKFKEFGYATEKPRLQ